MRMHSSLTDLRVLVRGAGEQATGIAHRLFSSHLRVALTEIPQPLAVRRTVAFSEAVWDGEACVEGVRAVLVNDASLLNASLDSGAIPVLIDPGLTCVESWEPHVVIDAAIAKRNLGTTRDMAQLVIGYGPGFTAGVDVDVVIETNRGHNLGRVIFNGSAQPNTGIPGTTEGYSVERVLRAPADGVIEVVRDIGSMVSKGDTLARVDGHPVTARIDGLVRGMIRGGATVSRGLKVGDVDPRGLAVDCMTISDKARALGGAALEAILWRFNQ